MGVRRENRIFENITWNERKNTIFHAKYQGIRSIVCLLPETLLIFCSVIYSNLSKKMSSHFTLHPHPHPPPPPVFFSADAHDSLVLCCHNLFLTIGLIFDN